MRVLCLFIAQDDEQRSSDDMCCDDLGVNDLDCSGSSHPGLIGFVGS